MRGPPQGVTVCWMTKTVILPSGCILNARIVGFVRGALSMDDWGVAIFSCHWCTDFPFELMSFTCSLFWWNGWY